MRTEQEAREAVIAEALEWVGTPYVSNARVKGKNGGCDCLTFLATVYELAGVIDPLPIPHYPQDWHLHQDAELYLFGKDETPGVLNFCREIEGPPQRGDLVLFKFGKCFSHSAIVINWPTIIHAWARQPVNTDDAFQNQRLVVMNEVRPRGLPRPRKYFTVKEWR